MAQALEIIQATPEWDIIDASKLTTYLECPRKFFYSHILGWKSTAPNNHLVFGSSWAIAMAHLRINGYAIERVMEAMSLFYEHYRNVFSEHTDELFEPKTPKAAANAIALYARSFASEAKQLTLLHAERAGLVLVSEHRTMIFKCDSIYSDAAGGIISIDDKTSQRKYSNWGDHWVLSTQMLTYLHALHCMYPDAKSKEIIVRCAFFTNKGIEFADHSIRKTNVQMQAWLDKTNAWIDRLDNDMRILKEDDSSESTMLSFPMNDTACFNFGRQCAFFDFCNAWSNPLSRCESAPMGFEVNHWNPLHRPEIREFVDLTTKKEGQ